MALAVMTNSSAVSRRWSPGGLFRLYLKQQCVQSSKRRSFTLSALNYNSTFPSGHRNHLAVRGYLLNVHDFNKLFHSSNYQCNPDARLTDSEKDKSDMGNFSSTTFPALTTVHMPELSKKDEKSLISSSTQLMAEMESDLSDDEDPEEKQKQKVWEVAPMPLPTYNFAAYANESEIIKKFADLGVNLSKLENKYGLIPLVLKLNFNKQVAPCIR